MIAPQASKRTASSDLGLEDEPLQTSSRRPVRGEKAGCPRWRCRSQCQCRGQAATVGHSARSEHRDRIDRVDDLGDERHCAGAGREPLTSGLAALGDHDVDTPLGCRFGLGTL